MSRLEVTARAPEELATRYKETLTHPDTRHTEIRTHEAQNLIMESVAAREELPGGHESHWFVLNATNLRRDTRPRFSVRSRSMSEAMWRGLASCGVAGHGILTLLSPLLVGHVTRKEASGNAPRGRHCCTCVLCDCIIT